MTDVHSQHLAYVQGAQKLHFFVHDTTNNRGGSIHTVIHLYLMFVPAYGFKQCY